MISLNDVTKIIFDKTSERNKNIKFIDGYSNPITWHRQHQICRDGHTPHFLKNVMEIRDYIMEKNFWLKHPDYIWKLFVYNMFIGFEYILKDNIKLSLDTIKNTESLLSFIDKSNDPFLKSIRLALYHCTLSMKGFLMECSNMNTDNLSSTTVKLDKLDNTNLAALEGAKSLFFYEYSSAGYVASRECAFKAVTYNDKEAEWHYLQSRASICGRKVYEYSNSYLKIELESAKKALALKAKTDYKLQLVKVYLVDNKLKFSRHTTRESREANDLLISAINDTEDLFVLSSCLYLMTKLPIDLYNANKNIVNDLVNKLSKSKNADINAIVGNYYNFKKRDYKTAQIHYKIASDGGFFGATLDYVFCLYIQNPSTTPVDEILKQYLPKFLHITRKNCLLTQIILYLLLNDQNLMKALKYIDSLLDNRDHSCIHKMKTDHLKYAENVSLIRKRRVLPVISEALQRAMMSSKYSSNDKTKIKAIADKFKEFNEYVERIERDGSFALKFTNSLQVVT